MQEAACYLIQSNLHKYQEQGLTKTEEEVKVHILSNLQLWQDAEASMILSDLENKVRLDGTTFLYKHKLLEKLSENFEQYTNGTLMII